MLVIYLLISISIELECVEVNKSQIELKEKSLNENLNNKKQVVEAQVLTSTNSNNVYYNSSLNKDLNKSSGVESALDNTNSQNDTFIVKGRDYLNNVSNKY